MNVLLVDSDTDVRSHVEAQLRHAGLRVLSFSNPEFAFLYLLSRPKEVDAVAVNLDGQSGFLRRLDVLGPVAAVTYSGLRPEVGGEIALGLLPASSASTSRIDPVYEKEAPS